MPNLEDYLSPPYTDTLKTLPSETGLNALAGEILNIITQIQGEVGNNRVSLSQLAQLRNSISNLYTHSPDITVGNLRQALQTDPSAYSLRNFLGPIKIQQLRQLFDITSNTPEKFDSFESFTTMLRTICEDPTLTLSEINAIYHTSVWPKEPADKIAQDKSAIIQPLNSLCRIIDPKATLSNVSLVQLHMPSLFLELRTHFKNNSRSLEVINIICKPLE